MRWGVGFIDGFRAIAVGIDHCGNECVVENVLIASQVFVGSW